MQDVFIVNINMMNVTMENITVQNIILVNVKCFYNEHNYKINRTVTNI